MHGRDRCSDSQCSPALLRQSHLKGCSSCCTSDNAPRYCSLYRAGCPLSVMSKLCKGYDVVVFHAGYTVVPGDPRIDDVAPVYCRSQAQAALVHNSNGRDWEACRRALPLQARRQCRKGCTRCCDSGFLLEMPISAPSRGPLTTAVQLPWSPSRDNGDGATQRTIASVVASVCTSQRLGRFSSRLNTAACEPGLACEDAGLVKVPCARQPAGEDSATMLAQSQVLGTDR